MKEEEEKTNWAYKGYLLLPAGTRIQFDELEDDLDMTVRNVYDEGAWNPKPGELIHIGTLRIPAEKVLAIDINSYKV
jgi:hypothetical protein